MSKRNALIRKTIETKGDVPLTDDDPEISNIRLRGTREVGNYDELDVTDANKPRGIGKKIRGKRLTRKVS